MEPEPKPPAIHEIADPEQRLAALFKWMADHCAELEAQNPEREPQPKGKPWFDKPGTLEAAEKDVFRGEMSIKLVRVLCANIARCEKHRCRRSRRCEKLETAEANLAAARAVLAAEQAKWEPRPAEALSPGRRRKGAHARRNNGVNPGVRRGGGPDTCA